MYTIMISGGLGAFALYLAAEPAASLLFGSTAYLYELQLFSITILLGALIDVGLSFIRARQKPVLFVSIGVVTLVLQVSLNILFVVVMDLHVSGVVYSMLLSSSLIATVLASVAVFYVNSGDRCFLRIFGGLAEVGLYALAWRISSILLTLFETFQMSWFADQFEVVKKANAQEIYNQIFRVLAAALFLVGADIALFAGDFFRIMTSPVYLFYKVPDWSESEKELMLASLKKVAGTFRR